MIFKSEKEGAGEIQTGRDGKVELEMERDRGREKDKVTLATLGRILCLDQKLDTLSL